MTKEDNSTATKHNRSISFKISIPEFHNDTAELKHRQTHKS